MNEVNEELIKSEIQDGLEQVDSTLRITDFECCFDRLNRQLKVTFTATNDKEETIKTTVLY